MHNHLSRGVTPPIELASRRCDVWPTPTTIEVVPPPPPGGRSDDCSTAIVRMPSWGCGAVHRQGYVGVDAHEGGHQLGSESPFGDRHDPTRYAHHRAARGRGRPARRSRRERLAWPW